MSATVNAPGMHSDKAKARALAIVMHVAFIVLLIFGVSWQKKPETPAMADLWSSLPPMVQPVQPAQPKLDVTPPVPPDPKPVPKVTPPPVPKAEPVPTPKPDIALRDKDKDKDKEKKKKAEPKPEPKPEPKKREDDSAKRERDRKLLETEAETKAASEKAAADKAAAVERAAKASAAARENQKYISGIRGKVYARVAMPPDIQGNPEAEFVVSLLPGGELLGVTLRKSSGNPAYDAAVERAIRQAQPFDVPSGEQFQQYFRQFPMVFRPR